MTTNPEKDDSRKGDSCDGSFADEKAYLSFVGRGYVGSLISAFVLYVAILKFIPSNTLVYLEQYYVYLWPPNIRVRESINLGDFSDLEKISFILAGSVFSAVLLLWAFITLLWKINSRKNIYYKKILLATFFISMLTAIVSGFQFSNAASLYNLSFSQPMLFNIIKNLTMVAGFYLSAHLFLYSLISAVKRSLAQI